MELRRAVAVSVLQGTLAATLLGAPYVAGALPGAQHPPLADVLHYAAPPAPSLLGLKFVGCTGTWTLRTSKRCEEKKSVTACGMRCSDRAARVCPQLTLARNGRPCVDLAPMGRAVDCSVHGGHHRHQATSATLCTSPAATSEAEAAGTPAAAARHVLTRARARSAAPSGGTKDRAPEPAAATAIAPVRDMPR